MLQVVITCMFKLDIQFKMGMYVSSDSGWYSIHFDIVR